MQHAMLPLTWQEWDGDQAQLILMDVVFNEDFGPWKKDQEIESLTVDNEHGKLVEYDSDGKRVKEYKIKMVPA